MVVKQRDFVSKDSYQLEYENNLDALLLSQSASESESQELSTK